MGVESLYNQESFSDLTLKLGNGATIKVHKTVICSQNEYFNKLCGPESHFAERDQDIIELKGDDPEAVTALIRHLYGLPATQDLPWRFWLSAITVADKYLAKSFCELAWDKLYQSAVQGSEVSEVAMIIKTVNTELNMGAQSAEMFYDVATARLNELLKIEWFCEWLEGENKLMMRLLKSQTARVAESRVASPANDVWYNG